MNAPLYPAAIGLFAVAAIVLLVRRRPRHRRSDLAALALGLLTLAMSLKSRRFIPFFGIALAVTAAQAWLALAPTRLKARRPTSNRPPWRRLAVPSALLVLAAWRLAPYPLGPSAFDPVSWASRLPVDSLNFIEANDLRGNVFVYYLWGGYVHWRTAGSLRVHFDTRSETVFPDEIMREHERVTKLGWDAAQIVDQSAAELVLWPMNSPAFRGLVQQLERSGRWRRVYRDGVSALLVRSSVTLPAPLRATPDSGVHWWALGRQALDEQHVDEAATDLEHALAMAPRLWPACQDLAIARAAQGNREVTVHTVERCRAIFPDLQLDVDELMKSARPGKAPSGT